MLEAGPCPDRASDPAPFLQGSLVLSEALYLSTQQQPALLGNATVLVAFLPVPWLLPPRWPGLPYSGLHSDLDALLAVQSRPAGRFSRSISVLLFSHAFAEVAANNIFSLVAHAGVENYIVATWDSPGLEACLDMNLPCYDARALLPLPLGGGAAGEAAFGSPDFLSIMWLKAVLLEELVGRGLVVHMSDADVAYARRDLWTSYLAYAGEAGAAAAMQEELQLNTGNLLVLPTAAGLKLARAWRAAAPGCLARGMSEQAGLDDMAAQGAFIVCDGLDGCRRLAAAEAARAGCPTRRPLVRRTRAAGQEVFGSWCAQDWPQQQLDACLPGTAHLYFHALCVTGAAAKIAALQRIGFWFLDGCGSASAAGGRAAAAAAARRCRPAEWAEQASSGRGECDRMLAFRE